MASRPKRRRIQIREDPKINDTETLREIEEEIFLDYCHEDRQLYMGNELEHLTNDFCPGKMVTEYIKENTTKGEVGDGCIHKTMQRLLKRGSG